MTDASITELNILGKELEMGKELRVTIYENCSPMEGRRQLSVLSHKLFIIFTVETGHFLGGSQTPP